MTIAESIEARKQKGLGDLTNVIGTGMKIGSSVARAVAGDWVGAIGTWVGPQVAKDIGGAFDMFKKWKERRDMQPFVSSSDRGF